MIHVTYSIFQSTWFINRALKYLASYPLISFDTETKGIYTKEERKEAKRFLKDGTLTEDTRSLLLVAANNSGLSYPEITLVTHFIFGISEKESLILLPPTKKIELLIWKWLAEYEGKIITHNSLFDLKIMYHRIQKFPKDFEDTMLLAKSLINHTHPWKAKVQLKELMGSFYDPNWTLIDEYEPDDPTDKKFLRYASIDGAATYKLWENLQEYVSKCSNNE